MDLREVWNRLTKFRSRRNSRRIRLLNAECLEDRTLLAANQFAVIGDYGDNSANEAAVAAMVKSWDPAFIITVGDNNYESGAASTIDANIGKYFHEYIGNYKGNYGPGSSTNRFFPSLGNHDWRATNAQPYLDYFTLPGNERYYDFVRGPVHFFALDSDPHEPDGITSTSKQAQWLRSKLANSTSPFQIVYFHHAPYSSGNAHGSDRDMQWPFKEWGVDAVLAGHNHVYERLMIDGLLYFVNGLGGDSITAFGAPIPGSQVRFTGDYGAMLVTMNDNSLKFDFYSVSDRNLEDSYTLTRSGSPAPSLPSITISNATVTEGDSGTVNAIFNVTLSAASSKSVSVEYATGSDTATSGTDFTSKSGTITFSPGVTKSTITVAVKGDTLDELDEKFKVSLSSPSNATIADGQAIGTIKDDDTKPAPAPTLPKISIDDASAIEGNTGKRATTFMVRLSAPSTKAVSVQYATSSKTATEGKDFVASSGTITFAPGDTSFELNVAVQGDKNVEPNEQFQVTLSDASQASLSDAVAVGTIQDDDSKSSGKNTFIPVGSIWRYLDNGNAQGSAWRHIQFDDNSWSTGVAEFGYGDGDEDTVVSFGKKDSNKQITTYFRHEFSVSDPDKFSSLRLRLKRDDGAVVYLNGTEVVRDNMPAGSISYNTHAKKSQAKDKESTFFEFAINAGLLRQGNNVIAVEVHQADAQSSDMSFDLELQGTQLSASKSLGQPKSGSKTRLG